MNRKNRRFLYALALVLAGCEVGPNYQPPKPNVRPSFSEIPTATQPSQVVAEPANPRKWWTTFHDDELNRLIDRAVAGNLDLQVAESRLREARLGAIIAGARLSPDLNVDGGYNHARGSKNITIPAGAFGGGGSSSAPKAPAAAPAVRTRGPQAADALVITPASGSGGASSGGSAAIGAPAKGLGPLSPLGQGGLPGVTTDVYQVGFDSSWEIDVFGGLRRGVEAAQADVSAAQEDQRSVLVSLMAEVAQNYIELRGIQRQDSIARENLGIQQDTLELTKSRYKNGFATQLDVARQTAEVATTAARIPPLEYEAHQRIHALGELLGKDPDELETELADQQPIPPPPPTVPVGLPSDLLRRRPDIRRAERQIAGASARVGVATADLFPKFELTGMLGLDSTKPKNLFNYSSRYYSIVPGVTWPIFSAGRIESQIKVQDEEQQQSILNYQETVLSALREVEDSLSAYRTEQLRQRSLAEAVTSSRQALELARQQYQQGVTDFLTVLDTQRSLLTAQDSLALSDRAVSTDLVALYKSLGGGWEEDQATTRPE